ncbi:hypothetical protein [Phenylobacterium sp.]|uniref:hypothetical protein n=1 Tax=Phenylobacterium sp. TaxID=1871053 RepID=UPI00345C0E0B
MGSGARARGLAKATRRPTGGRGRRGEVFHGRRRYRLSDIRAPDPRGRPLGGLDGL